MFSKQVFVRYEKTVDLKEAIKCLNRFTNWEVVPELENVKNEIKSGSIFTFSDNSMGDRLVYLDGDCDSWCVYDTPEGWRFNTISINDMSHGDFIRFESYNSGTRLEMFVHSNEYTSLELTTVSNADGTEYKGSYYDAFMLCPEFDFGDRYHNNGALSGEEYHRLYETDDEDNED